MKIPHLSWNYKRLSSSAQDIAPLPGAIPVRGEIPLSALVLHYDGNCNAVRTAFQDLEQCRRLLQGKKDIPEGMPLNILVDDPESRDRNYEIGISSQGITLRARGSFGASRALYRLRSQLCLRRAPFLRTGKLTSKNSLDTALTYPGLKSASTQNLDWPDAYAPGHLLRIARAGYTGFHLNAVASLFWKNSKILPELNNPDADANLSILQKITEAAGQFGLEIYLTLYLSPYPETHPVFQNHPETRGSHLFSNPKLRVLCSSSETVRAFHCEAMTSLFQEVPALGGIIAIAGCEGWLHCHTACAQLPDGRTDCPQCRNLDPEQSVAEHFNAIARAVKQTAPQARFIVWNYHIYSWTEIDAKKFISRLSPDCTVMGNFDTGEPYILEGIKGISFDYSLRCTGPSGPFLNQKKHAAQHGLSLWGKCESGTCLEYCSLKYVPAMTRWQKKFSRLLENTSGALMEWKFLGYNGGLAQELGGLIAAGENRRILRRLAARDFGTENADFVLSAWKNFDRAMDYHPFSIHTAGYFQGPFFIGPGQPLFLTYSEKLPSCFLMGRNTTAARDLEFTQPFGPEAVIKALKKMLVFWQKGMDILNRLQIPEDRYSRARLKEHRILCEMFLRTLKTALAMTRFFYLRDSLKIHSYTISLFRKHVKEMKTVAEEELQNARTALELLKQDRTLYFSTCYRPGLTEEMLRFKISHTEHLIQHDLPMLLYKELFSFNIHPSLKIE